MIMKKPKLKIRLKLPPHSTMKLKLTGYKATAPKNAVRVEVKKYPPNFDRLIDDVFIGDSQSPEFSEFSAKLGDFYDASKGEHEAIYFWIERK